MRVRMVVFVMLLCFSVLWFANYYNRKNKKRINDREKGVERPPHPKDFANYYEYKAKLIEFNESQYKEYLEKCKKGEAVYIEKEIISPKHEKRLQDFEDLLK